MIFKVEKLGQSWKKEAYRGPLKKQLLNTTTTKYITLNHG